MVGARVGVVVTADNVDVEDAEDVVSVGVWSAKGAEGVLVTEK
jgi:hypothetical protein